MVQAKNSLTRSKLASSEARRIAAKVAKLAELTGTLISTRAAEAK